MFLMTFALSALCQFGTDTIPRLLAQVELWHVRRQTYACKVLVTTVKTIFTRLLGELRIKLSA